MVVSPTGVGVERELTHHQHRTIDVGHREIHLPRLVAEDAEMHDLIGKPSGIVGGVTLTDAHEHQQSAVDRSDDRTVDDHLRRSDPLQHCSHGLRG